MASRPAQTLNKDNAKERVAVAAKEYQFTPEEAARAEEALRDQEASGNFCTNYPNFVRQDNNGNLIVCNCVLRQPINGASAN